MKPLFTVTDLDSFLDRLSANAVAVVEGCHRKKISIAKVFQHDRRCTPVRMVELILNRKLEWVGTLTDVAGYAGLVIDYEEVLERLRGKAPVTKSTWAKEFGVGQVNAAIRAMDMKVLSEISPISNQPVFYVPAADVERVRREFISLRDISVQRGHSPARVQRNLGAQGIHPIESDNSKLFIYRRSDLT